MRSYNGGLGPNTYFANGYCSLFGTKCTGEAFLCDSATFGDYAAFTACPAGSVMVKDTQQLDIMGYQATLDNKNCAKGCTADADCRTGETDSVYNGAASQYACLDKGGVKFCFDPRDLTNAYTAEQF
jgi:hypothetical protein